MKTIIVATDFSQEARNATDYILPLAKIRNYRIVLFYLKNVSIHALNAGLDSCSIDNILEQERKMVEQTAQEIYATHAIETIPYFATGIFYDELEQCIDSYQAAFVVMGMAEKSIDQDLLGNTTTAAINKLEIPILAIPLHAKFEGIRKVLYACDMTRGVHKKIFEQVRLLAHEMRAEVEIFHVKEQVDQIVKEKLTEIERLKRDFVKLQISYKDVISSEVIRSIKKEIEEINADILIMVPYRYGFWNSLIHRSKTRMMASGNNTPLLSIPIGEF